MALLKVAFTSLVFLGINLEMQLGSLNPNLDVSESTFQVEPFCELQTDPFLTGKLLFTIKCFHLLVFHFSRVKGQSP